MAGSAAHRELRREIELLAIWYIPVAIATIIASGLYTSYFNELMSGQDISMGATLGFLTAVPAFINLIDNVVVGVWLFALVREQHGRYLLWLVFGVFAHLFAAVIYIALRIYEQRAVKDAPNSGMGETGRTGTT